MTHLVNQLAGAHTGSRLRLWISALMGFALAYVGTAVVLQRQVPSSSAVSRTLYPRDWHGQHIVVALLVSSGCAYSNDPATHDAYRAIVAAERRLAEESGGFVTTLGVAVDESPSAGWRMLGTIAPFDEILTGGGWLSTGALRFAARDLAGPLSVPQVLVLSRPIWVTRDSLFTAGADSLHRRLIGRDAIVRWAQRAASFAVDVPPAGQAREVR